MKIDVVFLTLASPNNNYHSPFERVCVLRCCCPVAVGLFLSESHIRQRRIIIRVAAGAHLCDCLLCW